MQPVLKEKVWGGCRLVDLLGKDAPADQKTGESWELADHPHGTSTVAEGPLEGKSLRQVLESHGRAVLGGELAARGWADRFGLLIKFIDATDRLSVQVHPDDAAAARSAPGESGKTECWTILHAEPDAWIIRGLKPGTTRESFAEAIEDGRAEDCLEKHSVKAGDFVWLPAGTVHAIGPGIVLAEVQQNSDVTYRVYDWGRVGLDGKPRELHVEQALDAANFSDEEPESGGRGRTTDETGLVIEHLVDCPTFSLSRVQLDRRPWAAETAGTFAAVVVLAGRARLAAGDGAVDASAGDTILVPAEAGEYAFESPVGLEVLIAAPPGRAPRR
jgi:mannose-6-phosphate isomerase